MEFFDYATLALQFVNSETIYVPLIVGTICFLIVFVFQGIGLFILAGREGIKNRWMAFIPFLNTYYLGECARKNKVFNKVDTRYIGIAAAILECLLFAGYIVYYVAQFKLLYAGCVYESTEINNYGFTVNDFYLKNVPENLYWAGWCFDHLYNYLLAVDFVFLVLRVLLLISFFQTYMARRYFLFTITSIIFPIQGILIFTVRNNRGMNYREFMRMEQERQYRMYQQYTRQNFEQNPYNRNPYSKGGYEQDNPYNEPPRNQNKGNPGDPFGEFSPKDGNNNNQDPFD